MLPLYKRREIKYYRLTKDQLASKLMEIIIRDKLMSFLEENIMINNTQHGFRNKRSCLTYLLDFYNDVFNMYDETKAVYIIYLDFQKAFDKIPHNRLLKSIVTWHSWELCFGQSHEHTEHRGVVVRLSTLV